MDGRWDISDREWTGFGEECEDPEEIRPGPVVGFVGWGWECFTALGWKERQEQM